jgi:outer membrane protein assembly factor BamB
MPSFVRGHRSVLLVVSGFVFLGTFGAGVWAYRHRHQPTPAVVRGSAHVEFTPRDGPVAEMGPVPARPKRRVGAVPWRTYGYDLARSHLAPFRLRPPYRRLWMVFTGGLLEFPPAVADGRVYVAQLQGHFLALDAATGKRLWWRRFEGCSAAAPTVAGGVIYEPYLPKPCAYGPRNKPGFVVALDARTGNELWRFSGPASESSTVLVHGVLYFGAWDGKIYALDARTRKVRWTYQTDGEIDSSPAYQSGTLYIGTNGGSVYALDARSGRLRWRFDGGREYFYATPTIAYGRVFIGNTDGTVYALGARTGHVLWVQRAGTYVYTSAAVWRRTVYVGSYDGYFTALDAATGDVRWRWEAPAAVHGAPTVMDGLVYFSSCSDCALSASRYVKSGPRGTYALDARTGRLVWRDPAGTYSPIVSDGVRVYLVGQARVIALAPRPTISARSRSSARSSRVPARGRR